MPIARRLLVLSALILSGISSLSHDSTHDLFTLLKRYFRLFTLGNITQHDPNHPAGAFAALVRAAILGARTGFVLRDGCFQVYPPDACHTAVVHHPQLTRLWFT